MSKRAARCTEADIKRAMKAAVSVGVHAVIEILPDGTIRIDAKPANLNTPKRRIAL